MGVNKKGMSDDLEALFEFDDALESVVGYRLPGDLEDVFAVPQGICFMASKDPRMAPATESQKWSKVGEHINEVRQSLSAMHYHLDNVTRMQDQLDQIVQKYAARTLMARRSHWNPNVTNRLTFEYHAFAFVAVRCLIHVSFTVGRVFGKTCPNLLSLQKALDARSRRRDKGAAQLLHILRSHEPHLAKMFRAGTRRSIRDHIAHESFLPAGSLKITGGNATLLGVLESGSPSPSAKTEYRLSEVMQGQLAQVEALIREMIPVLEQHCLPRIP